MTCTISGSPSCIGGLEREAEAGRGSGPTIC